MSILNDEQIIERCEKENMISPYEDKQISSNDLGKVISYGVSSFGYDTRISNEFKIFTNINSSIIDPKDFCDKSYVDFTGEECIIPPNSFILCRSLEYFKIPKDLMVVVVGKSTYARTGLICNVTPLEPGWEGHITIEISNTTPLPAKVYANEGIAQLLFFKGKACSTTYADRSGKYQGQTGVTLPRG